MQPERFRGGNMREAMVKVREAMGEDAMVLSSRSGSSGAESWVEIVAASPVDVAEYRRRMKNSGGREPMGRGSPRIGPFILALVGPAGSGKTLTAVKLALSHQAFGRGSVGFITLDTYRVGGVNELQTYAEIAGIPLEVVYSRREIPGALRRLRSCDAIIVDTPGRVPGTPGAAVAWEGLLRELDPQEIHLVLPAGLRIEVARHLASVFRRAGVTHILPAKLDQVPGDAGLAALVEQIKLPARWVADGQEVPGNLRPAGARLLAALGSVVPGDGDVALVAHGNARKRVQAS